MRQPKTVKFTINDKDPDDQYARLFADDVVSAVEHLTLPRYGLGTTSTRRRTSRRRRRKQRCCRTCRGRAGG